MNKLLKTAIVGTALLTVPYIAFADETATETTNGVSVTGTYEGTVTDSGTYTQSVDFVAVGTSDNGTVTMNVDETGTVGDVYVDTTLLGSLDLRLGKVDGVNGMKVSTTIAGFTVSVYQPSGSNQSLEVGAGADVGPISITGTDILDSARLLTANMDIVGIDVGGSYQKTTTGTNTILDAGLEVQGIGIDVANASIGDASVTKIGTSKHALLGVMTTATNGTSVKGVKASLGDLSAKVVNLNSTNTYTVALARGIMTYSYAKTAGSDGTVSAGLKFTF
jgi:hypothetical protein|tara:strand:- start:146 stop:979 length:834 start_codon:yes stop_codon:yes gene_type:complete